MKIDAKFIKEKLIPDWYIETHNNVEYSVEDYENQSNESN